MSASSFFLVWSPTGSSSPSRRHKTFADAKREAERLAEVAPHAEFFVLAAVSASRKVVVKTEMLRTELDDGIPF